MAVGNELGIRIVILGLGEFRRASRDVRSELDATQSKIQKLSGRVSVLGSSLQKFGSALSSMGRAMTFSFTLPLLTTMGGLIGSGIRFEDAFAGVGKTVDGVAYGFRDVVARSQGFQQFLQEQAKLFELSGQNVASYQQLLDQYIATLDEEARAEIFQSNLFGQLTEDGKRMREEFRKMALEIPIGVDELARVGQVAGQLGVPAGQIVEFTKVAALMGVTTDLSAEQAAFAFARIGNIMGVSADDLAEYAMGMGNAIVALGNNAAATEPEIVNMALRIAAAGRVVGLTEPQILGISTTLTEMGVRAEMGGTAVSRVLQEMFFAVAEGGETAEEFANIAGMSVDEFAATLKGNPVQALSIFLEQLADLQDAGQLTEDQLLAMGLSGIRVRQVLNSLGPNVGGMTENIELATRAWEEQIALQEEAAKRFATVKSQIQLLKNAFVDLGITLFDLFKDDISNFVNGIRDLVTQFKELSPETQKTIVKFALIAAAIGPTLIVLGTLIQSVGTLVTAFAGLAGITKGLGSIIIKFIPAIFPLLPFLLAAATVAAIVYNTFKTNFLGLGDILEGLKIRLDELNLGGKIRDFVQAVISGDYSKALDILKNTLSGLSDIITGYLAPALKIFFERFINLLTGISYDDLAYAVGKVVQKLSELTGIDTSQIEAIGIALSALATLSLIARLFALASGVASAVSQLKLLFGAVNAPVALAFLVLAGVIKGFTSNIFGFRDQITKLKDEVEALVRGDGNVVDLLKELVVSILGAIAVIPFALAQLVFDLLGVKISVERRITDLWNSFTQFLSDLASWVLDVGDVFDIDLVNEMNSAKASMDLSIQTNLIEPFKQAVTNIKDALVGDGEDSLKTKLNNLGTDITNWIDDIPIALLTSLYMPFKNAVDDIFERVFGFDSDAAGTLNAKLVALPDNVIQALSGLGTALKAALVSPFENAVNSVIGFLDGILTKLSEVIGGINGLGGGGVSVPTETASEQAQRDWDRYARMHGVQAAIDALGPRPQQWGGWHRGGPMLVGERGPELWFPKTSGFVASNHFLRNLANTMMNPVMAGGYSRNTNIYNPVFNAAPTREIIRANSDIYSEWIISGMANR